MANLTDDELHAIVLTIDRELSKRGVPIFRRPMAAAVEFQRRTGIVEAIADGQTHPGVPESHSKRIARWYDDYYGSRQHVDASPGATILVIRGEPWRAVFPRMWGTVHVDVRKQIADLPPKLDNSMTPEELEDLDAIFGTRMEFFHRIESSRLKYLPEARRDLVYGVADVCKSPSNLPMAKLFFSHAAEKSLKGFILSKGGTVEHHHRLKQIVREAEALGLPAVPRDLIKALFCPGGARYGEFEVNQAAAIVAHDASLTVIEQVLVATA